MRSYPDLNTFFIDVFRDLPCDEIIRSYITGVFSQYKSTALDLSRQNITLAYAKAHFSGDFSLFQKLGDWLLYIESFCPEHLNKASKDYYFDIGKLSYYSCYRLINKKWLVYEYLADDFIPLTEQIHQSLLQLKVVP